MILYFRQFLLFFSLLILCNTILSAQDSDTLSKVNPIKKDMLIAPEIYPSYPGGEEMMIQFLVTNIDISIIPKDSMHKVRSKVMVGFTVDTSGQLENIHILNSAGKIVDEEVIRVLKLMPPWNPAQAGNRKIPFDLALPVRLKLG